MSSDESRRPSLWVEIGVLVTILALAGCFRLIQLDTVPPGMTHDEAAFGAEAEQVLAGGWPIYFSLGYGHEPAYAYAVALGFLALGHTLFAMRVTSAICGLLVVIGTYLVGRRLFGFRVAAISAAWMAVAFWPLSLSRQALRAITLPMLWLPAVWFFWGALDRAGLDKGEQTKPLPRHGWFAWAMRWVLAGLFLGSTLYTYMASRVTWALFVVFVPYLLLQRKTRELLRRAWPGLLIMLLVAGLVALPLVLHLNAHPEAERRFVDMMGPIHELLQGRPDRVLRHAWNAVRVFSWIGDRFWVYNIPGRPVFNWLGSLCFYAGLALSLWRWRDPRYAFILMWFALGFAPAVVTTNQGIFLRAIVAQPATYLIVAVALEALYSRRNVFGERHKVLVQVVWAVLVVGLVVMEGVRTYDAYFVDWPVRPAARNIYNHNLVAAARYLDEHTEPGAVGVSALAPLYYHDPWIVRYVTGRENPNLRWFDGRGGIVYPAAGPARYVFSEEAPLDPVLAAEFGTYATLVERVDLAADDENPFFEVWRWQGGELWEGEIRALEERSPTWISSEVQFTQPDLRQELPGAAQFGDVMSLVAYRLNGASFEPGDVVELVTYWRALRTVIEEDDWVTFVHLLDVNSQVRGGTDVLHCPPTGWQPNDLVVQVHRFTLSAETAAGQDLYPEVGVYRRTAGRLPVVLDGTEVADRVLLASITVQ